MLRKNRDKILEFILEAGYLITLMVIGLIMLNALK